MSALSGCAPPAPTIGLIPSGGPRDWTSVVDPSQKVRIEAVIDFVEIELHLVTPTHPDHLLGYFERANYVDVDRLPGGVAARVKVRVYDQSNCEKLAIALSQLTETHPLSKDPLITAVEVSMDFYIKYASAAELGQFAAKLFRHCKRLPSQNLRASGVASSSGIFRYSSLLDAMSSGTNTIYVGSQKPWKGNPADPISLRFYAKTHDRGLLLPEEEWRARMEVTLQGEAVPFRSIEQASMFDFARLAKHFKYYRRRPISAFPRMTRVALEEQAKITSRPWNERPRNTRERVTVSDPLGQTTYLALKTLTRRWSPHRGRTDVER